MLLYERMSTRTRFEKEAKGNLETGNGLLDIVIEQLVTWPASIRTQDAQYYTVKPGKNMLQSN